MVNKVVLSGELTRDPDMSYTEQGMAITRFELEISLSLDKEKSSNAGKSWINITVFHDFAEKCNTHLRQGLPVIVDGRLVVRKYKGRDRLSHTVVEIVAEKVLPLEKIPYWEEGEDEELADIDFYFDEPPTHTGGNFSEHLVNDA